MQDGETEVPDWARELEKWRRALGWTQVRAAKHFKVHPRTYQGWEAGRRKRQGGYMIQKIMELGPKRKKAKTDNLPQLPLED